MSGRNDWGREGQRWHNAAGYNAAGHTAAADYTAAGNDQHWGNGASEDDEASEDDYDYSGGDEIGISPVTPCAPIDP